MPTPTKDEIIQVEQACLRLVVRAIRDYYKQAVKIFKEETDKVDDIAEDVTREALDTLGVSKKHLRLYGKVDYKKSAVIFLPEREIEVALMIDSKAERSASATNARIQMSQISMKVHQIKRGVPIHETGLLKPFTEKEGNELQTITIIVKYLYDELGKSFILKMVKIACIPSGLLQDDYNPNETDTIWNVGPHADGDRGEDFRVRLNFQKLKGKAAWRVVEITG